MGCLCTCLLYVLIFLAIALLITKIYLMLTCGKYEIKRSLKGKVVLITGGTAGIGKETVRELAKNGATVHVLARNLHKADKVIGEIKQSTGSNDIYIHHVDLSDFSTIRSFAKNFLSTGSPIHILINNAGLINAVKKYTVDGNEDTVQANHLSHFLLTHLLLDRIIETSPSRIINVTSNSHAMSNNTFDIYDMNYNKQKRKWGGFRTYCHTKLMNVLSTRELARRVYGKGVTVNSVHPGGVRTEVLRNIKWAWGLPGFIFFTLCQSITIILFKTEREGAATTLYTADCEELEIVSGQYFAECKLAKMSLAAVDDQLAIELWKESEQLTGLDET